MRSLLLLLGIALPVWAHQSSVNSNAKKLKWPGRNVPLVIQTNTSDLSATTARNIILDSMAQWNFASTAELVSASASNNVISFQSDFSRYGSAVIGVTEVSSEGDGAITKAVVRLNDNYTFMASPGLYSGSQVYLGDVVTHELGHFLGLAHSEVLNASMFYANFPGQADLNADDKSGIRTKYDTGHGRIYGKVKGGDDIGVLGAHVQLISRKTGDTVAVITDENGTFDVRGLDVNDTFYIYTAPLKNLSSLPAIYSNVQTTFCPASYVGSFYSACGTENDGNPQGLTLTASRSSLDAGTVSINCELRSHQDYELLKLNLPFTSALNIFDYGDEERTEKAFVGYFQRPSDTSWSDPDVLEVDLRDYTNLSGNQKYLKVSLVSQPFGNQLEYALDVSQNGSPLPGARQVMSRSPVYDTYATDLEVLLPLSSSRAQNIFELSLAAKKLSTFYLAQTFPSSDIFSTEQHLPYLLMTSLWENRRGVISPILDTAPVLSDNDACLDAPFTFKVEAADIPEEKSEPSGSAAAAGAGCGTIEGPDDRDGPSSPGFMVGLALGSLMIAFAKRAKNFLS